MKLTRSRDDVIVSGVLGGLGDYFEIDPTLIRIGVAILIFFSPFPVVPLYFLGAILIPKASKNGDKDARLYKTKSPQRDRKGNRKRDFNQGRKFDQRPSSPVDDIDEEDWSDF